MQIIGLLREIFSDMRHIKLIEWRTEDSIFQFILNNIGQNGKLQKDGYTLPDEKKNENELRFMPGFMDTVFGPNDSLGTKLKIIRLVRLVKKILTNEDLLSQSRFYEIITRDDDVVQIIDRFLAKIEKGSLSIEPNLLSFSKDLAFRTGHRNAVKFGIALLGLSKDPSVLPDIKILGLHDEFTIFSTLAILHLSEEPLDHLLDLAQKVDGWGRIQLVNRMVKMELLQKHKDWLIFEGYKNNIMYEYLAYECAVNGDLNIRLQEKEISEELFESAREIIESLIMGGPAEDISDYDEASILIANFIRHAKTHTGVTVLYFTTLHYIKDFLERIQDDLEDRKGGWTKNLIQDCLAQIEGILESQDWTEYVVKVLNSKDNITYWNGKYAAKKLGINIWPTVWERLLNNPLNDSAWYDATEYGTSNNADEIVNLALKTLPLEDMKTGPKDILGLGPEFINDSSLGYLISFLESYPGKGEQILLTGLASPVTRNRNMTLRTLEKWGRGNWTISICGEIEKLKELEPNNDTKVNIGRLLSNEELV